MTAAYRSWPAPARTMAVAIDAAVTAAQAGDQAAFADAVAELRRLDREQLLMLLGAVVRELLERAHPDGIDADDAEQALQSCIRATAGWYPQLDSDLLIRALVAALGVTGPDDAPAADELAVAVHGLLLVADQLGVQHQRLAPFLDGALQELMREQTIELP